VSASAQAKADRYLTEGRVVAFSVNTSRAEFTVHGSGAKPYRVIFRGEWSCDCPARVSPCAHILACQKITRLIPTRTISVQGDDELSDFLREAMRS
jgi:uncharacterized Zn finger protein